jgi:alpha-L-fucosidase
MEHVDTEHARRKTMKCKKTGPISVLALFLLFSLSAVSQEKGFQFIPDDVIKHDNYTVLIAQDGRLSEGLEAVVKQDHRKFHVIGWKYSGQQISWDVTVPSADNYEVSVLLAHQSSEPFIVEVQSGNFVTSRISDFSEDQKWRRLRLNGTLRLNKGKQTIVLKMRPCKMDREFDVSVYSIELVLPDVRERLSKAAMAMRADCEWFRQAKYGLMFHWVPGVFPKSGDPKPYAEAVREFNVSAFVEQVVQTGAGLVTLTTSHALHFFPAPLRSLDSILPGRTAQRDLISELADALGKHGIKLMLYYHLGANSDPNWQNACGFWDAHTDKFFGNWMKMMTEIGNRYGAKVAGYWFDDGGMNYYYRSAPWEALAKAAKAGYSQRMISYNPWIYPSTTEFQDYYTGEENWDPSIQGTLHIEDNGIISEGAYKGLQASAALVIEDDWAHLKKNAEISLPKLNAEQLARTIQRYGQLKNVPMFNLEIYEDGTMSPKTIEVFRSARKLLDNIAGPEKRAVNVIPIKTNASTYLYGSKAVRKNGDLTPLSGENTLWKGNSELSWIIDVPQSDKIDLFLNAAVPENIGNIKIVIHTSEKSFEFLLHPTKGPEHISGPDNVQRIKVATAIPLQTGCQEISLHSVDVEVHKVIAYFRSLELVPDSAARSLEDEYKRILSSRASYKWISKAGYGLMFHWTSESVNPNGSCKPYADAVKEFNVKKFADMVEETGAGYIIFTIGHAEPFCPAPLKSWEKYHPGKTTERDLIKEIANALGAKKIKLMCYVPSHVVAKYNKVDDMDFMKIHLEILQEMGERYGDKIAGYWFDDWYRCFEQHPNVSFEAFFKATKVGNPDRIIALNSYIYPPVTLWQEYWAGEVTYPVAPPVNGFMNDGPAPNLRYHALLIMEPYWVQTKPEVSDPKWNAEEFSKYIRDCMAEGGAVTINMGIYQDGTVGKKALQVMKRVRNNIRNAK